MPSKKLLIAGILLLAGVALICATQVWLNIQLSEGVAAQTALSVTGQQLSPPLAPMALALAALALALTIAGRVFRYVLGAVGMLLGAGIVILTLGVLGAPLDAAAGQVTELTGIGGSDATGTAVVAASQLTFWAPLTAAAGLVAALFGLAVIVFGSRWLSGGRKYETATTASAAAEVPLVSAEADLSDGASGERDRFSDWDLLSNGADPSADTDSQDVAEGKAEGKAEGSAAASPSEQL